MLLLALIPAAVAGLSFEGQDYYIGDLHAHTGASKDGGSADLGDCAGDCGALATVGEDARAQGLDFLALVDHVNSGVAASAADYATVLRQAMADHDPAGGFVTLPGAEIFFTLPDDEGTLGHKTLLLFGGNSRLAAFTRADAQPGGDTRVEVADCVEISRFMNRLRGEFGLALLLPHHPGSGKPMPTDWSCEEPSWAPAVEVYSEHGNSLGGDDFDPLWGGSASGSSVMDALDPVTWHYHLGFVAGSDNHDTRPGQPCTIDSVRTDQPYGGGLTIAMLPTGADFQRESLYTAIRDRQTLATTGPFVPLAITYTQGASTWGIGAEALLVGEEGLEIFVQVPVEVDGAVDLVLLRGPNGAVEARPAGAGLWTASLPADAVPAYLFVDVLLDGDALWDAPCADGGEGPEEHVWSSPTWFAGAAGAAPDPSFEEREGIATTGFDTEAALPPAPEAAESPFPDTDHPDTAAAPASPDGSAPPLRGCSQSTGAPSVALLVAALFTLRRRIA